MDKEHDEFETLPDAENANEEQTPPTVDKLKALQCEPQQANDGEISKTDKGEDTKVAAHLEAANTERLAEIQQSSSAGFCPKCGAPLINGMPFCGNCGTKVRNTESAPTKTNKSKGINAKVIVGIAAAAIALVLIAVFAVPALTITSQQLIAKGNFEKAYSKASDDQKLEVLAANLATVLSKDLIEDLSDPDSYQLRSIYFDDDSDEMILEISANNKAGGRSTYWYDYRYNSKTEEYQLELRTSSLEDEVIYKTMISVGGKTYYQYNETAESLARKMLDNGVRERMRKLTSDSNNEISSEYVDSINTLYETENSFESVELIESIDAIYPSDSEE